MEEKIQKQIQITNKIFPWLSGLSGDLIFFIAIDTLFLTQVKGLDASTITFTAFLSCFICVIFQKVILHIIKRIGNTNSFRIGLILLFLSSIFLLTGKTIWTVALYRIFRDLAKAFMVMKNIILKDNLIYAKKEENFVPIITKAQIIYAIVTMINAITISYLYKVNTYYPIYISILFNLIWIIMSFFITDVVEKNRIQITNKDEMKHIKLSKIVILILIAFLLFSGLSNASQDKVKLLIQYDFSNLYTMKQVTIYLGIIVLLSRIGRVFTNILFKKLYPKLKDRFGIILSCMMGFVFIFALLGHRLVIQQWMKNTLMTIGFILILALRDPYEIYIRDLILRISPTQSYQKLLYTSNMLSKISEMVLELMATIILLKGNMEIVLFLFLFVSCMQIIISMQLYKNLEK